MDDRLHAASTDRTHAQRAADHLANERTFLAWVRSAVAVIGLGFVVARFGLYLRVLAAGNRPLSGSTHSSLLGDLLIALGTLMVPAAFARYLMNQRRIAAGDYTPSPALDAVLALAVTVAGAAMFALLLASD